MHLRSLISGWLPAVLFLLSQEAAAFVQILADETQNGGVFLVDPADDVYIHSRLPNTQGPTFTLTGGATTSGVKSLTVGTDNGTAESSGYTPYPGYLTVRGGSHFSNSGSTIRGGGAVTVRGAGTVWQAGSITAGFVGSGTLQVTDGGVVKLEDNVFDSLNIGNYLYPGQKGAVTVSGSGSRLEAYWRVNVAGALGGRNANGSLDISDGGSVMSRDGYIGGSLGSKGSVSISGFDSTWTLTSFLEIGDQGVGELKIRDGGKISAGSIGVGRDGGFGAISVSGPGARMESGSVYLVAGNLEVSRGGALATSSGTTELGSSITVTGSGSRWSNSGSLYLSGPDSRAVPLTVSSGGEVHTQTIRTSLSALHGDGDIYSKGAILGGVDLVFDKTNGLRRTIPFGSGGQLHLDFDGTGWLGAGNEGDEGSLTIKDGVVVSAGQFILGYGAAGNAVVEGEGTILTISGGMSIGSGNGMGRLTVRDGAEVEAGGTIGIYENGVIDGNGGVLRGDVANYGLLSPGNSPGSLTIDGDLTLSPQGTLVLEVGGDTPGLYDQLHVSGNVELGGNVVVRFLDGWHPPTDSPLPLLAAGSLSGNGFTSVQFENIDPVLVPESWRTGGFVTIAVPEPVSLGLILLALSCVAGNRSRGVRDVV